MAAFESAQIFPVVVDDLSPVARDVMQYFESRDYQVSGKQTDTQGWLVSVHKGGGFKQIMGMQSALNIQIEPTSAGTLAKAGIGIFGQQAIPTVLTMFIAWPVIIPQIWGLVQQSNLDEEALTAVQQSLIAHAGKTPGAGAPSASPAAAEGTKFCTSCGAELPGSARFCAQCGTEMVA